MTFTFTKSPEESTRFLLVLHESADGLPRSFCSCKRIVAESEVTCAIDAVPSQIFAIMRSQSWLRHTLPPPPRPGEEECSSAPRISSPVNSGVSSPNQPPQW